ncbi:MAG: hypothetical protein R8K49_04165 [Mariprofundaceae bacterium]
MHKLELEAMLPHRRPMLMISEVSSYDKQQLQALSYLQNDNPLLQQGRFPTYGLLELLAQASGLFLGLNMDGEAGPGAIISVRNMKLLGPSWFDIEQPLSIQTNFLGGSADAAMFQGEVLREGQLILQASLTVSRFK